MITIQRRRYSGNQTRTKKSFNIRDFIHQTVSHRCGQEGHKGPGLLFKLVNGKRKISSNQINLVTIPSGVEETSDKISKPFQQIKSDHYKKNEYTENKLTNNPLPSNTPSIRYNQQSYIFEGDKKSNKNNINFRKLIRMGKNGSRIDQELSYTKDDTIIHETNQNINT
ncbi:hypothetical protein H8356DRAFT_1320415 [Neocallimastix lanati (nom. inval.)]|nr:hypothetical protein H8356DRAFT_1320415 [Neocallimastix sp. JGI-2020a]